MKRGSILAAATGLLVLLSGCSPSAAGPAAGSGAPSAPAGVTVASNPAGGSIASDPAGDAGGGASRYEGSLTTSGLYAATWTVSAEQEVAPFTSTSVTITSDKGTFGNIQVSPEGEISFGSGADEFSKYSQFTGTAGSVTLDPMEIEGNRFVCAFTVDTDLKSSVGAATIHLTGSLTAHWHPVGIGDINCP